MRRGKRSPSLTTRGLGHHKILRASEVVTGAVEFLLRCRPASHPLEAVAGRIA